MNQYGVSNYIDKTSEEIKNLMKENSLVIPIGSIEQHGPHLPLSVDIDISVGICRELCSRNKWIMGPEITYTARSLPQSGGGSSFPGTVGVRGEVLINYFIDIISSFSQIGVKDIYIINGHYENEAFIFEAIEICREKGVLKDTRIIALSWWSAITNKFIKKIFGEKFLGWHAEHAGLVETSLMLYLKPNKVRFINTKCNFTPIGGVYSYSSKTKNANSNGVLSSSEGATAQIGSAFFYHICSRLEKIINQP